jgi:acetyl-CoA C-acetyltransferase
MTQASREAASNAGAPSLLRAVNRIAVPQGSWSLSNPARLVASRIGAENARTYLCQIGVSQQEVIDDALDAIASGQADVVLVVGGEARAFARLGGVEIDDDPGDPPDVTLTRPPDFMAPIEAAAGTLWPVVQQYALIENALAAHEHQERAAHTADIARLWARFNDVAQRNELAAFPTARSAEDIARPDAKNRPLAYPYNRWHASQWTVDQAAALLLCSTERARDAGVPTDRWVFPHVALHASHAITLTARRDLHAWPAMEVLGRAAAAFLGAPLGDLPIAEVYSCFPAAVRVQQRSLALPRDGTPTVTGGMTFAGGPFNNYVLQSMAAVIGRLRARPGEQGLVTTVSGMLSKPGLAVWSATPWPNHDRYLTGDLGEEASTATATVPVATVESARGPGTVASFTVTYDPDDPLRPDRTVVVAEMGDGSQTVAACEDETLARHALGDSLIGQTVHLEGAMFTP